MRVPVRHALVTSALCLLIAGRAGAQDAPAASSTASDAALRSSAVQGAGGTGVSWLARIARDASDSVAASPAQATAVGPTARGAAVGVRAMAPAHSSRAVLPAVQQEPNLGRSKALMIVGGAALVAGLLIGDDAGALLAVGGAVVGLYGLYQFVR